jgi:hypothetical protein
MKRAFSDSDYTLCNVSHKRGRLSLPATAPTPAKWAGVMGWLRAVPLGTSAEEAQPNPQHHEESQVPLDSISTMERHPRPESSNLARREKKTQTRKQSVGSTKEPEEYRSILLSEASIFIDREFAPSSATPDLEALIVPPEMQALVDDIAKIYYEECRDSAMSGVGEGNWGANACVTVMSRLRRCESLRDVLKLNSSDGPWRQELKPVRATMLLQTTVVLPSFAISPTAVESKDLGAAPLLDQPCSFKASSRPIVCPPINSPSADLETPRSDSLSYTSGYTSTTLETDPDSLSTPKPDICVGLAHEWFPPNHHSTLNSLKTDPHRSAMGLHLPFLIFEAGGHAGLFGAQNQAAVGAACMLRILDLIRCGEDTVVWSVTTEGPIHELWAHYRDSRKRYQSVHMDLWRMTKMEHAKAFVETMAKIMIWGSRVFAERVFHAVEGVRQFEGS